MLGTTDGGKTWSVTGTLPAPIPNSSSGTNGVFEIRFATASLGWAYGPGDLYLTANGGRTWAKQSIPGGGKDVIGLATSAAGSYAIVSPCAYLNGFCTTKPLTLWHAVSRIWRKVPVHLPISDAAQVSALGKAVYVADATETTNTLFASTDGTHFTARTTPCGGSMHLQISQVAPVSGSHVDVLCSGDAGFSQADKEVFRSVNAGKTFTSAGTMGPYGIQSELAVSPSGDIAVASSSDGSFMYVNDSGRTTWNMIIGYSDGGSGWNDLIYTGDNEAWVIYAPDNTFASLGKVYVTRDGGRHWNLVAVTPGR